MNPSASTGLEARRAVDPGRYALGGLTPRLALRPSTPEEVAEAMRAAARDRLSVVPWGAGVALAQEGRPPRYDLALDLSGIDRIVEYDPEDFTLTAESGASLASLRGALAANRQELPLEAPHAHRATLGGVLAADASGPRRLRFGAPHDRILGARFALADGTLVRSGGKVVKNVAGYGTHRLLCGSRGGLAVLVEASLKLAPAPEARVALCYGAGPAELADAARWAKFPRLEPSLLSVVEASLAAGLAAKVDATPTVVVGLEDDRVWVNEQEHVVTTVLGPPKVRLEGEDAAALWQSLADLEETPGPRLSFTGSANTPAALAPLLTALPALRFVHHAPAGRLHLFPEGDDAQSMVDLASAHGLVLIDARGLAEIRGARSPQAGVRALRARIRAALDPHGTLALGESWAVGSP
jgi:glycolate oxidase FAD binding subunit